MQVCSPHLFVVSGGPGSGKTSVLDELAKLGYRCAPEVARQIIQEQVGTGGKALPWRDHEAYTHIMLQRSIPSYLEHASLSDPVFSDRGIPDTLCYARLIGVGNRSSIREMCFRYRYAPDVFLAPPWKQIYQLDNRNAAKGPRY